MKAAGIIAEFDPFHKGHKYLLDTARAEFPSDALAAVMSGNFVQRGSFAVQDKFARAEAAVKSGVDLVLELPSVFAVNSAGEFAKGGIRILKGLGCVSRLVFGSECEDRELLCRAAELTAFEGPKLSLEISQNMKKGMSYPAAYAKAISEEHPELLRIFDSSPNDLLAVEYLRENIRQNAGFEAFPVKRAGAEHGGRPSGGFSSASFIRAGLFKAEADALSAFPAKEIDISNIEEYLTPETAEALKSRSFAGKSAADRLFGLLRYAIISKSKEELAHALGISEGLENKLKKAVLSAESAEELIALVKSRRFTHARIARIFIQILLGIDKETYALINSTGAAYARILAFSKRGAELLSELRGKTDIPVYTNINRQPPAGGAERIMLDIDIRASELYAIISGNSLSRASDYFRMPHML